MMERPRPFDAVIFDLDGTLYDKKHLPARLAGAQFFHLDLLQAERKVRKALSGMHFRGEESFYTEFFTRVAVESGHGAGKVRDWYFDKYLPSMVKVLGKHYRLRPWVQGLFMELRARGIATVVYSDYGAVEEKLQALGFKLSWADRIYSAPAFGGLKPDPAGFRQIARELGLDPGRVLVVGDRDDTDGEGARRSGMGFTLVPGDGRPGI